MSEIIKDKVDGLHWEIAATNHPNPDITTGQHTNGPATIFVKGNGYPWLSTGENKMHLVRQWVEVYGSEYLDLLEQFGPRNQQRTYRKDTPPQ